jgi:hypothetical protein
MRNSGSPAIGGVLDVDVDHLERQPPLYSIKKNPTQSNNGSSHPSQLYRKRKKRRIEGRDGPDRGGGAIHGRTRWTGARPIRPFCKERGILPELRKDSEEQGAGQSRAGGGSSERLRARDCCLLL